MLKSLLCYLNFHRYGVPVYQGTYRHPGRVDDLGYTTVTLAPTVWHFYESQCGWCGHRYQETERHRKPHDGAPEVLLRANFA